jgi:hypothetical protein
MAYALGSHQSSRRRHLSVDSLSVLELLLLVPTAGVLALWLFPKWFDVQWSCITGFGVEGNTPGDVYSNAVGVLGTLGWIVVAIAVLFAHIAARPRLAALIPALWFGLFVGGALVWAAAIGPSPCPA